VSQTQNLPKPHPSPFTPIEVCKSAEIRRSEVLEKKSESGVESDPGSELQVIDAVVETLKVEEPKIETPTVAQNDSKVKEISESAVEETKEEEFDTPIIHYLVLMGFDKSKVKKAVEKYTDLESALNRLLDEY